MRESTDSATRKRREAYYAVLGAMSQLQSAAAILPSDDPAHQDLDQARLQVSVALDAMKP